MSNKSFLSTQYHANRWYESGSWQELMLVGAALKLGVFSALAGAPQNSDSLAKTLGLDQRATSVFLTALAKAGYLDRRDQAYSLTTAAMKKFGNQTSRDYLGWAVLHSWRLAERWLSLPAVLETGQPLPGNRFSESVEGFVRAMDVYAGPTADQVAKVCLRQMPQARTVLDIGGATGTVSKIFADQGLAVTLFDTPEVIEVVGEEISAVFSNIKPVGGDFNKKLPKGPFDIAFLGNVTHIYGPAKNLALYRRVHKELVAGGLIAIQDYVRGRSPSAAFFGINMLVNTADGGTWTQDQYADWLTAAGFAAVDFLDLAARDQQLILAKKAPAHLSRQRPGP